MESLPGDKGEFEQDMESECDIIFFFLKREGIGEAGRVHAFSYCTALLIML